VHYQWKSGADNAVMDPDWRNAILYHFRDLGSLNFIGLVYHHDVAESQKRRGLKIGSGKKSHGHAHAEGDCFKGVTPMSSLPTATIVSC
jgi:hypothetical protein